VWVRALPICYRCCSDAVPVEYRFACRCIRPTCHAVRYICSCCCDHLFHPVLELPGTFPVVLVLNFVDYDCHTFRCCSVTHWSYICSCSTLRFVLHCSTVRTPATTFPIPTTYVRWVERVQLRFVVYRSFDLIVRCSSSAGWTLSCICYRWLVVIYMVPISLLPPFVDCCYVPLRSLLRCLLVLFHGYVTVVCLPTHLPVLAVILVGLFDS